MDIFSSIADQAMFNVWGRTPRGYQRYVIPHILRMTKNILQPGAILMVQATGSGKSSVPQTVAIVDGGITIIIENTLALSSDQISKIKDHNENKNIVAFQLDEIKTVQQQVQVAESITTSIERDSSLSIFLFTSPESLLKDVWLKLFKKSLLSNKIKLLCIDEVHLFVDFGLTFRKHFTILKEKLFNLLIVHDSSILKIPVLYMTATFNYQKLQYLIKMTGINVLPQNVFWGDFNSFQRRNIYISSSYTNQIMKKLKSSLETSLLIAPTNKAIIYSNTAVKAIGLRNKVDNWLDSVSNLPGDTAVVIGDQETELKFAYTTSFTTKHSQETINDINRFSPRILIGTSGCIGAGLDCDEVKLVFRVGLPTSILNLIQEMGRCGRKKENDISTNKNIFDINFSLSDYVYLNKRLYVIEDNLNEVDDCNDNDTNLETNPNNNQIDINTMSIDIICKEEQIKYQKEEIKMVAQLVCLNYGCYHSYLEYYSGNPSLVQWFRSIPCMDLCPHCDGSKNKMIKTVSKNGLSLFIADALINHKFGSNICPMSLAKALFNYPDVGKVVYNRPNSVKAESGLVTEMTIMQLIASGIIEMYIELEKNPKVICKIGIDSSTATPHYLIPLYWNHINCF